MWQALLPVLGNLLDKIIPDPAAAAAAKLEAMKIAQSGELAELDAQTRLALAQIGVNQADATGGTPMQRNWRPMIGWVCAAALAWDTVGRPIVIFALALAGKPIPPLPTLNTEQLYGLLAGLLGLGGLRTYEKVKEVA